MSMSYTVIRKYLGAIYLLVATQVVYGQPQQPSPWVFSLDGGAAYQSNADLENSDTGFSRDRLYFSAGLDYGWSRRDSVGISVGGGNASYDFEDPDAPSGGYPWSKIEESRVSLTGRFGIGETGSLIVIPSLRRYGEPGTSSSDSLTYGLLTAAFWRINEMLTIGPGIGVFSRLEQGKSVFPILAIDWDIAERWNLSTGGGLAATRGPGLTLQYQLSPDWSLDLSGRYEEFEFRLGDEGAAPGGVGSDKSIPVVLSARYQSGSQLSFSAFVGAGLEGRLRLRDAAGELVREGDYDSAMILGATFSYIH